MIICEKCGAEVADDMNFCTECGEVVTEGQVESLNEQSEEMADIAPVLDDSVLEYDEIVEDVVEDVDELHISDELFSDVDKEDQPVVLSPNTVKSTTIFTTKGKNNFSDKFVGLILLGFILALSFFAFSFGSDLTNSKDVYAVFIDLSPLFIVALSGLLLARTGNIDFTPVAIMMTTYFLLVNGFNDQNIYTIGILVIGGAIVLGLLSGILSALSLIPNVLTSIGFIGLSYVYISTLIEKNVLKILPKFGPITTVYIPIALAILSFLTVFVIIYISRLGKPMFLRKGIMMSDRTFFTLTHIVSYLLAVVAGIAAAISAKIPFEMTGAIITSFDYIIAIIFIISICGASSLFDNKVMPQVMFIVGFLIWFALDFVIVKSFIENATIITDFAIKVFYLVLALIADRVYSRNQLPEYYNTTCVQK